MQKQETKFSEYFELPNPNLRAYFARVRYGQPDEYRTPFYKERSLSEILDPWIEILKSDPEMARWPSLLEFEFDLAKKVGPMSIMQPLRKRLKDIDAYYEGVLLPHKPIPLSAVRAVVAEWGRFGGLRIRSDSRVVENMKLSTNSGSPHFEKRSNALQRTLPCKAYTMMNGMHSHQEVVVMELGELHKRFLACAVLGWRGQEGGPSIDDVKQRIVWMFPFAVNIKELGVYQPLIEALQREGGVPAWVGMDAVDVEITRMFDTKGADDLVVCTDFTKFDQHFNESLQCAAEWIIRSMFTPSEAMHFWLTRIFPIKYMIPLAYDWDCVRTGKHGMGSGSGGTNADETCAHRALQHEAAQRKHAKLNPHSQCLGDDGVLTYPGITVNDVVASYTAHGLEMNPDKQYASKTDCVYLRRWHHVNYRVQGICAGVYSTCRALGRLAEQERYYDPDKWSREMVALRQLSIIENCKFHPLREKFAEYCMKGDKYRLGLDIPGFLDNIDALARKSTDLMPEFLGYSKSLGVKDPSRGIKDWWIVKYLNSKR